MTEVCQPADQASDLRQSMSTDGQTKPAESAEVVPVQDDNSSDGGGDAPADANDAPRPNGIHEGGVDPAMYYPPGAFCTGYVYDYQPGYEGNPCDWEPDYRYAEGSEAHSPLYSDTGSVLFHGYPYPQPAYGPFGPGAIPAMGPDGQLYGPQSFPYPSHLYSQQGGQYLQASPVMSGEVPAGVSEPTPPGVDGSNSAMANGNRYPVAMLPPHGPYGRGVLPLAAHNPNHHDPRTYEKNRGSGNQSWADVTKTADGQQRPANPTQAHASGSQTLPAAVQSAGQTGRPNSTLQMHIQTPPQTQRAPTCSASSSLGPGALARGYPPLGRHVHVHNLNGSKAARVLASGGLDSRSNGRSWPGADKGGKPRGRGNGPVAMGNGNGHGNGNSHGNGNGNLDVLNEQNRGPRTTRIRSLRATPGVLRHARGQGGTSNGNNEALTALANKDQYNRPDFPTKYEHARFFVIKSYSEDDVHKSIKYNVWASTPNGNKRLEVAYQDAQTTFSGQSESSCPIFLFFSVNASGQFCGVAEMAGSVDFNKSVDYWQQDKWNGRFSVKWHIIKDIANCYFRHIILENNDNKPVTNSRDTQEIKFEQGLEMLTIFKNFEFKTSILDDFQFYENRQRAMQEKKARQHVQQQREHRQQGEVHLAGNHDKVRVDDASAKLKVAAKATEVATENGHSTTNPRILCPAEVNSRHAVNQSDICELTSQRLGQLSLTNERENSSASSKDPAAGEEGTVLASDSLSADKNGSVKQEN